MLKTTEELCSSGYEKRERVRAAVSGDSVDRPPLMAWFHQDHTPSSGDLINFSVERLARGMDLDVIKIMSDARYPFPMGAAHGPRDWRLIDLWPDSQSMFVRTYVEAVRRTRALLGPAYPLIVTVYSPGMWAHLLSTGVEQLRSDFAANPAAMHNAMANLAGNLRRTAQECIAAGADGIFLSLRGCDSTIPADVYRELCRPYDLMVLQGAQGGWLNIVHVHGDSADLRVDDALAYGAAAVSWAAHTTGIGLDSLGSAGAGGSPPTCVVGGLDHTAPTWNLPGAPDAARAYWREQARRAVGEAGSRLILAPGCSIPRDSSPTALLALRSALDDLAGSGAMTTTITTTGSSS